MTVTLNTHRDLCCLSSSTTTAESTGYNTPTETVSTQQDLGSQHALAWLGLRALSLGWFVGHAFSLTLVVPVTPFSLSLVVPSGPQSIHPLPFLSQPTPKSLPHCFDCPQCQVPGPCFSSSIKYQFLDPMPFSVVSAAIMVPSVPCKKSCMLGTPQARWL
jgi:hypothetical protein